MGSNRKPIQSSIIKVHRAKEHFNAFIADVKAFEGRNPYVVWADEDSEPAIKLHKVKIVENVPALWSAQIGDIVHNLASALDGLATSLVVSKGFTSEVEMQETYFPISGSEVDLSKPKSLKFFARVGPEVEKAIRAMEPYRGGKGDALWRLHRLDIIDKHRTIIAVGANLSEINFDIPAMVKLPDKVITRPFPAFPLKDGDELFRTVFFEEHFDAKAHFSFGVAFNETKVVDREPVIPTLRSFIEVVDQIVEMIYTEFFKPANMVVR
jgi:hypothetical protein